MVLAAIVACAVLIILYRMLFGPRLHMSNGAGRARQPRLGVVDAFDLDRQRQLVLVRRDNVEHLIMIGGPNDLVIESAFIRSPVNLPLPLGRDKDGPQIQAPMAPMPSLAGGMGPVVSTGPGAPAANGQPDAPPAPLPAALVPVPEADRTPPLPIAAEKAVAPRDLGPLADIPAPAPVTAPAGPEVSPADARPETDRPVPPRPVPPLPRPPGGLPPRPLAPPSAGTVPRPPTPLRPPVQASSMPPRPTPIGPRPATPSLTRGTSAAAFRRDTPATPVTASGDAAGPEGAAGAAAPPPDAAAPAPAKPNEMAPGDAAKKDATTLPTPATPPTPPATANTGVPIPTTLDTLESLEEEMAKLLGRPVTGPDKG